MVGRVFDLFDLFSVKQRAGREAGRDREPTGRAPGSVEQFQLAQAAGEPFMAAVEGLIDRFGRGGETALEDREGKADRAGAFVVLELFGAVKFITHIVGDPFVEIGFGG